MTSLHSGFRHPLLVRLCFCFGAASLLAAFILWFIFLDAGSMFASSLALVGAALMVIMVRLDYMQRQARIGATTRQSAEPASHPAPAPARGSSVRRGALHERSWSLDVFAAMDAPRFAAVCEAWFSWSGFGAGIETHRTLEGVDIWLHAARTRAPVAIVRCRYSLDRPVGVLEMQEFFGVVSRCQSAHGTYTTTSTYTPEALQFAQEHGIDAVDGSGLLRRIQTRTRHAQQALLAVAFNRGPG